MTWDKNRLQKKYDALKKSLNDTLSLNRREFLKANSEKIVTFYKEYARKSEALKPIHEEYLKRRNELKAQYHSGSLEGEYRELLFEAGKEYNSLKRELSLFSNAFMRETFPKNINGIRLEDVIREGKRLCR